MSVYNIYAMQAILYQSKRAVAAWKTQMPPAHVANLAAYNGNALCGV